ncbi:hypothetical protein KC19_8G135200 [Ceratodon purpureus]|uniref:Uncharacterized protein n=1 Tax=Ceratodon purpureus TaxID=3225 RepID=A0A8T0H317_CERPU|nr:hypothetical protein KC19_8G135200 [Ceratodon purpureus]
MMQSSCNFEEISIGRSNSRRVRFELTITIIYPLHMNQVYLVPIGAAKGPCQCIRSSYSQSPTNMFSSSSHVDVWDFTVTIALKSSGLENFLEFSLTVKSCMF